MKTPKKIELLYDIEHIIHIKVKEDKKIEQITHGLQFPKEYTSLGRREDLMVIDEVKIVETKEKELENYNLKYNIYVPLEYLSNKENIGTVFNINKKYHSKNGSIRIWDDVAKVVMFTKNQNISMKCEIDDDENILFLR